MWNGTNTILYCKLILKLRRAIVGTVSESIKFTWWIGGWLEGPGRSNGPGTQNKNFSSIFVQVMEDEKTFSFSTIATIDECWLSIECWVLYAIRRVKRRPHKREQMTETWDFHHLCRVSRGTAICAAALSNLKLTVKPAKLTRLPFVLPTGRNDLDP